MLFKIVLKYFFVDSFGVPIKDYTVLGEKPRVLKLLIVKGKSKIQ